MKPAPWLLGLLLLGACKGEPEEKDAPVDTDTGLTTSSSICPTDLLWEREVKGFFDNWCTPCHSSAVVGDDRRGAPAGMDFDTLANVKAVSNRVLATATGDTITMPPAGGTPLDDRAMIAEWVQCGMPGTDTPEEPSCDDAVEIDAPATLVAGDGVALCAGVDFARIPGSVTIEGDVQADCLCAIDGDVVVSSGRLASARLERIGGGLTLTGTATGMDVPELVALGGALEVRNAMALTTLSLPWLRDVGGPLSLVGSPTLASLELGRVGSVQGPVTLQDLPALDDIESLVGIHYVPGDLTIRRTGVRFLDDMRGFIDLDGALIIEENQALVGIDGFWYLDAPAGGITIADNPLLRGVTGFDYLLTTPRLELADNGALEIVTLLMLTEVGDAKGQGPSLWVHGSPSVELAFPALTTVRHLQLEGTAVPNLGGFESLTSVSVLVLRDNDALQAIDHPATLEAMEQLEISGNTALQYLPAFVGLDSVSGDVLFDDNPLLRRLTGLTGLTTVGGTLRVHMAGPLEGLEPLGALASVGGTFELSALGSVDTLAPLTHLEYVGGDFIVTDNPSLPTAEATALAGRVDTIVGTVTIEGNL